ncbi:single-stranded DNA-binding protein [Streptomyces camponoticapitis]|uniref:Single-stranded DNA-binding protein n=1 Tax=Streptomyces camponoticapitis TaxID=1616125 RepID=A0ABQ2DZR4_9ACTN|nr:single-stranded DNA-binding protein [Streptomyces camponoticapitis]GGJ81814.1 single-stranded DNA-binding protein [Streptomyces camponoticapitis]
MTLPTMTGIGRLTADPEPRYTASGKAVVSISLAFNSRRKNPQTQEWEDGDVLFIRGTAWERLAENATETLAKGMEVLVTGELRTESWEKDGQKQSRAALLIRSIAPSLAFSVATVTKDAHSVNGAQSGGQGRGGAQQGSSQRSRPTQPPQDDPWATGTPNEPPF